MNDKIKKIYDSFGGKLVGSKRMGVMVCRVLTGMTPEIIKFVTRKCWFMGSMEDAYAFTFTGNDIKDRHLIFLSDELFEQDQAQIDYTIAHEIGHVVLGHRNSTLVVQTKEEIRKQEKEADIFAKKYI